MGSPMPAQTMATVGGLVDLQAEAHKEAFEQGLAEGREAGARSAAVRRLIRAGPFCCGDAASGAARLTGGDLDMASPIIDRRACIALVPALAAAFGAP